MSQTQDAEHRISWTGAPKDLGLERTRGDLLQRAGGGHDLPRLTSVL